MDHHPAWADACFASHLARDDWEMLAGCGVPVHFRQGQVLFRQGDLDRHVYVVLCGAVKVVRGEADGGQAMLTVRTAGDVVGDMAALDHRARSATVTTLGRLNARMVTAEQFRRFIDHPSVRDGFTRYTVARLRQADEQRTELALLPVRARLARTLLRLAADGRPAVLAPTVRLSQHDIAQLVGASRNAVVSELTALRAAGILLTRRRLIVLLNVAALRQIASG